MSSKKNHLQWKLHLKTINKKTPKSHHNITRNKKKVTYFSNVQEHNNSLATDTKGKNNEKMSAKDLKEYQ